MMSTIYEDPYHSIVSSLLLRLLCYVSKHSPQHTILKYGLLNMLRITLLRKEIYLQCFGFNDSKVNCPFPIALSP